MSIIDARTLDIAGSLDVELCIIGAGAAGITLAVQLAAHFRDICVVESGGLEADPAVQALGDIDSTGYPQRPDFMSRARYYGGSCNLWAGRNMELDQLDLRKRAWVAHSGWPIPYSELARYYPAAAQLLRIPASDNLTAAWIDQNMTPAERQLLGSPAFSPAVSLWGRRPMRFGACFHTELQRAKNIKLILQGSVTALHANATGALIESVSVACLTGRRFAVRAKQFVLACGGLENARLLLVSTDHSAAGLANDRDLVGRFFMDHPRAVHGKVRMAPSARLRLARGWPLTDGKLQLGIGLSPDTQESCGLLNHYVTVEAENSSYTQVQYQTFVQTMQVVLKRGRTGSRWQLARRRISDLPEMIYLLSPKELMPHAMYRWYVASREWLPARPRAKTYVLVHFCEQPPDPDSRVTLSTGRDALGVQRLGLHWKIGDTVPASMQRMLDFLARRLQQTGLGELLRDDSEIKFTDASHHMGTTRMADSADHGVVDPHCRVHGIDNLHVAGSSVFPTAGHANPTLTIVALALRLADRLRALRASA